MARPPFPPAVALLVAAGRLSLDPSHALPPAEVAPEDWQASLRAAQRHGMSAWLPAAARRWPGAPARLRDEADAAARAQAGRALQGVAELSAVVTLLRHAGIEPVALKGPLFSRWVYGDLAFRRFADLDLLIGKTDRVRALEALRAAGYYVAGGMSTAAASVIYGGVGAWPLDHHRACRLDLHWRPQALLFGSLLEGEAVLYDSIAVPAAGCDVRIPSATHAATLAVVHAAKHLWASLELVLSIAHIMRRDDVDWPRVQALAASANAWSGAAASLCLASEIFGSALPPALRGIPLPPAVSPLQRAAREFLAMPDVAGAPRRTELRTHLAALDTRRSRIRYLAWRLLAPTPVESAWCRLPDRLSALYVPLRLIRLTLAAIYSVGRARNGD